MTLIMLLLSLSIMHVWYIRFLSHQAQQNYIFQAVELSVLSNHGHLDYTCIYRFRVHGISEE
jgi:SUN domain-containing protein 1/2